jgi:thymidylate kinase
LNPSLTAGPSRRAIVITFSGIDGAGKSTQIKALKDRLRELGLYVTSRTFWDDVVAFARVRESLSLAAFKGDAGVGSPQKPIHRRDKNVSAWYVTAVRLGFYLLDTFRLCWVLAKIPHKADAVIFDRYIFDELANLPLHFAPIRFFVRILLRLAPQPDVAFLLDADPAVASVRKPEYPVEFQHRNRNAYLALSRWVPTMRIIAPGATEAVSMEIDRVLRQSAGIDLAPAADTRTPSQISCTGLNSVGL